MLFEDNDDNVRCLAAQGLRAVGTKGIVAALLNRLDREGPTKEAANSAPVDDLLQALRDLGDETAISSEIESIRGLIGEKRKPERGDPDGGRLSHVSTLADLVRKALKTSPNPAFRKMASMKKG